MLLTCSCEMFTTEEGIYQEVASCLPNIKSLQKWLVKIALTFIIFLWLVGWLFILLLSIYNLFHVKFKKMLNINCGKCQVRFLQGQVKTLKYWYFIITAEMKVSIENKPALVYCRQSNEMSWVTLIQRYGISKY